MNSIFDTENKESSQLVVCSISLETPSDEDKRRGGTVEKEAQVIKISAISPSPPEDDIIHSTKDQIRQ